MLNNRVFVAAVAAALMWSGKALGQGAAGTGGANGSSTSATGGGSTSGGPGTLGTEMPLDSAVARSYSNQYMPSSGANSQQVQAGVQQLHASYQQIIQAATQAQAAATSPDQKKSAQKLIDDAQRDDRNLLAIAFQDEGFDLGGQAADIAAQGSAGSGRGPSGGSGFTDVLPQAGGTGAGASSASASGTGAGASSAGSSTASSDASSGSGDPSALLSEASRLSAEASKHASDLQRQARNDSRLQLASFLGQASKTLKANGP